ncbi:MAG: lysophospholipid acyltransferase family protein [Alphaproteobacteria bacterium]|nr:lysophospholipid acyltransferase family protein [Alphaproteobacteria bacterium]
MQTIRALTFTILFYGWTTLVGIAVLPLLLGPPPAMLAYGRFWTRGVLGILRVTAGITHQVRGRHLLPDGPMILAVKHQSAWDTLAINLLVRDPAIVLKKELLSIPVFGWCLWRARHIAVDRQGGSAALKRMVEQTRARAAEGRPIVIYPEGTRTKPGTRRPYHPGVAALYGALDLPVVPVALNSGLFWPRRSLQMHPGTITVEYLPPIAPGHDRRRFMSELEGSIEVTAEKLYDEAILQYFPDKSAALDDPTQGCG